MARGNRIDVLRVLLTVGIVCLHATTNNLQPIVWICSVCVPSFFALSGYLFFWNAPQKPEWRWFWGKIRSRIFTLLIPYLIAVVIAWLCYYFAIKAAPSMVDGFLGDRWKDPLFVFWTGPINLSLWFIRELMVVVLLLIFRFTNLRLYTQSVGINQGASRLNGINPTVIKLLSFVLLGVCVAVAAVIGVSRMHQLNHKTLLNEIEMDAILAVAIGGNNLGGGKFRLAGSILGAYIIQMLSTTLYSMGVQPDGVKFYKAIVIIILVVVGSPVIKSRITTLVNRIRSGKAMAAAGRGVE